MELAKEESCEFLPFLAPRSVEKHPNGKLKSITFCRTEQLEDGSWIEDEEQTIKLKCNFIISAFGSTLCDKEGELGIRRRAVPIRRLSLHSFNLTPTV